MDKTVKVIYERNSGLILLFIWLVYILLYETSHSKLI
jgi:hypothetical protein